MRLPAHNDYLYEITLCSFADVPQVARVNMSVSTMIR